MKNNSEIEGIYMAFLDSGELYDIMPAAKGTWEQDRNAFSDIYEALNSCVEHVDEYMEFDNDGLDPDLDD